MDENIEIRLREIESYLDEATAHYLGKKEYGNFRGGNRQNGPGKDKFSWDWAYDDRRMSTGGLFFYWNHVEDNFNLTGFDDENNYTLFIREEDDLDEAIKGLVEEIEKIPAYIEYKDQTIYAD